jgi:hypothetical protein
MPKVLRLHNSGSQQIQGWQQTGPLTSTEINTITDPTGGRTRNLAVSIPTPFARMHLFETAFDFVAREGNRNPNSVYHELVSHYWDLLELLYNYHLYSQAGRRITLRRWNAEAELGRMQQDPNTRLLGDTLRLFWQDERFRETPDLYLIFYESPGLQGGPRLLGGTSPLTMLFTAPAVPVLDVERPRAGGRYFDQQYVALEQRDPAFQDFVYELFLTFPRLQDRNFAHRVFGTLDRNRISQMQLQGDRNAQTFASRYPSLADVQGNPAYVRGIPLPGRGDQTAVTSSDLFIQPTRELAQGQVRPLVLRPNLAMGGVNYLNGQPWDDRTQVPYVDEQPMSSRVLPGKGFKYPYLTVGDLLADSLVELPYELNSERYHTGRVTFQYGADSQGRARFPYLLPLQPAFFEYFTEHDLAELLHFTIDLNHVRVSLRVPVQQGRFITLERSYYTNPQNPKDEQGREIPEKGRIVRANVGLGVFPFYKFRQQPEYNDLYKVMLVDADNGPAQLQKQYAVEFFVGGERITEQGAARRATRYERTRKSINTAGSTYYEVTGTHFDVAELVCPTGPGLPPARGLMVPRWKELDRGTRRFTFAVDFGTTNTHIAFSDGPSSHPRPLTIGEIDQQVIWLHAPLPDMGLSPFQRYRQGAQQLWAQIAELQTREFVPSFIGEGGAAYAFPIRTAVCETSTFPNEPARVLGNINIGFSINTETSAELPQNRFVTNLKWSAELDPGGVTRIEAFFREVMLLLKHKAALNGGIMEDTRVVWFAPLSFDAFLRNQFKDKWDQAFQQVFRNRRETLTLTESVAPYYYLTATNQVVPSRDENVVNIDIGGGTTDLLVFANSRPSFSTSFRFAGNDLWGDGYARVQGAPKQNGLLQLGVQHVESLPDSEQNQEYKGYLRAALKNNDFGSADVTSLLFLYDDVLRFSQSLALGKGRQLRVLFYLHYTSIIYHVGQLSQHLGLKLPRYLCFSGKGSLYLRLLAGGSSMGAIERISKAVLKAVTGQEPPQNFRVILADNPKEATTNGGVLFEESQSVPDVDSIKNIRLTGSLDGPEIGATRLKARGVDADLRQAVLDNMRSFLELVLTNDDVAPLMREVGVDIDRGRVLEFMLREVEDSLNLGLHQMERNLGSEETLPETMFFLPLKQSLYNLSRELLQG